MNSIGTFLRETRENMVMHLHDVHVKTSIDLSVLSRIENGKRLPTKSQLLQLAKIYNCDSHKLLVHWLSDKVALEVKDEEFGLEALQIAEEKILYGKPTSLIPMLQTENYINLESRRYIGSKAKLTSWIIETILKETGNAKTFIDLFAGTATVAKAASNYFPNIIINDILHANHIIYNAYFKDSSWDKVKLEKIINYYNNLPLGSIKSNYFSKNYGDKFFQKDIAKTIGFIREDIEREKDKLTKKEYSILLASLIYSIDKIANTVGHYDAYIKKPIKYREFNLRLINPFNIRNVKIFQEDANMLVKKIKGDIVYIDPPYNSRQYSRFYHLYENLVKWDKPKLYGVALKPEPENMSTYCTVKAENAFKNLIDNLAVKYIVVSYNNTYNSKSSSSKNKIELSAIKEILNTRGKTKVFESSHRYFNSGKTEFNNHKELLFITKVNEK